MAAEGGLPSLWDRVLDGERDRSSKDPVIVMSDIDSLDVQGLENDSVPRDDTTELRNGTRTDSSISSNTILTAGSSSVGSGGASAEGNESRRSRTAEGRLTSLGPFGAIYASSNFCHNIRTYADSGDP
jgi:hypothetical protein